MSEQRTSAFGIPLDVMTREDLPAWQLAGFCILGLFLVVPPGAIRGRRSVAFWMAVLAVVAATFREATLVPVVTTILDTRTSYPYAVVIPHSFVAAATYRAKHGNDVHYLQSFLMAFFLYGFGGSIVSDLLIGLPVTALSHSRIIPCYCLAWTMVWFSPLDALYQSYVSKDSGLHHVLNALEAIDSVTTPMGRISRASRELATKTTAPLAAGLFAGFGGAALRHSVGESNSFEILETGFWKTISYSLAWWYLAVYTCDNSATTDDDSHHCDSYGGNDSARLVMVGIHTIWSILGGLGLVRGHPLVWLWQKVLIGRIGKTMARVVRLGPAPARTSVLESSKKKD